LVTTIRKALLVFPVFITGFVFILVSWFTSYPVTMETPFEFVPDKISPFFWIGLSIVCASLYAMALLSKSDLVASISTLSIIMLIYSSAYFFWFMPGIDADSFRGLTEYFVETGDLNYLVPYHSYFQWPLLFTFYRTACTIGLDLRLLEFVIFGLIGLFYAVSLYSLAHKSSKYSAIFAVVSYFIIIWWYIDYQAVPFTLGFGFLLILFMLDSFEDKKPATKLIMLLLFTAITLTHSFVPLFFIIYAFVKYVLSKDRKYIGLTLITLIIHSVVLTSRATLFFQMGIEQLLGLEEYVFVSFTRVMTTVVTSQTPLQELVQTISRVNFAITGLLASIGFIILIAKRKLDKANLALLLSGSIFLVGAVALPILGTRALQIMAIPLSLGVAYLQNTKFKKVFQGLFLIIIILFVSAPAYTSFNSTSRHLPSQPESVHSCANFLIDYYYPNETSLTGTDFKTSGYLAAKLQAPHVTLGDSPLGFGVYDIHDYRCILYTIGLEKVLLRINYTEVSIFQEMSDFSVFYNSGNSHILVNRDK